MVKPGNTTKIIQKSGIAPRFFLGNRGLPRNFCSTVKKPFFFLAMKAITLFLILLFGQSVIPVPSPAEAQLDAQQVTTPLELSGLTPLWKENFTDGSIDKMQYTWAKGDHAALRSFVMPGAIYFGQEGAPAWPWVEQEINNFKAYGGEPLPNTLEFDLLNPFGGRARISLRPRRRGDFAHVHIGLEGNTTTQVSFANFASGDAVIDYAEQTGPSFGWAHVTVSYQQYELGGTIYAHYVVAINEEVQEFSAPSSITNPDWLTSWATTSEADGWSIEYNSQTTAAMGRYLANVRAYPGFLDKVDMTNRLQGRVSSYLAGLPDPRDYDGPTKAFQVHKNLDRDGPNALAYAQQIGPLVVKFDGSLSSGWKKITAYDWTFGDGNSGSGRTINHTYAHSGTYEAKLTVTNEYGTESHTIIITVVDGGAALSPEQTTSALPGSPVAFHHTLTNVGDIVDSFDVTATVNLPGWSAVVSPPIIASLAPTQSASFTVTVQVPADAPVNNQIAVSITAVSQTNGSIKSSITNTIKIKTVRDMLLSAGQTNFAPAGREVVFTHTLTNIGNITDSFDVAVTSDLDWPVTISPTGVITLPVGQSDTIIVAVQVPENSPTNTVEVITVTATSQGDNTAQKEVFDQITVIDFYTTYLPLILSN